MKSPIWTTIIFVSNVRTILLPTANSNFFAAFFFATRSASASNSISGDKTQTALFPSHKTSLRRCLAKA